MSTDLTDATPSRFRPGLRRLIGLALVAALGTAAVAAPAGAAPAQGPAGGAGPASVGAPATGTVTTRSSLQAASTGIDLCAQVAYAAGFRGNPLVVGVAVAMAESSCNPSAYGYNGASTDCPYGSTDRGLWQINNCYHAEVSDACAYDAQCNANAAYTISSAGTNWQWWSTYLNGAYQSHLSAAQAAVNRLGGTGGVTGTILAYPSLNVRAGPGAGYGVTGQANYGDTVTITCYTTGDYVSGGYWPSSTWDRISDPATGAAGYAADTWISTTYDVKSMVGHC